MFLAICLLVPQSRQSISMCPFQMCASSNLPLVVKLSLGLQSKSWPFLRLDLGRRLCHVGTSFQNLKNGGHFGEGKWRYRNKS